MNPFLGNHTEVVLSKNDYRCLTCRNFIPCESGDVKCKKEKTYSNNYRDRDTIIKCKKEGWREE